jgi:serine/threonine protein kinase
VYAPQANDESKQPTSPGRATNTAAAAAAAKKPDIPHTFDARYTRGKVLGSGAFSEAIECTSKIAKQDKKYACKITRKQDQSPEDLEALQGEIEILKKLNHPSIVGFVDNFEDNDNLYVVLELMQGGELFDRIVQRTQYSEKEARDLFIVITRGIKFLHDHHIAHRDLKPENLLMESEVDDIKVKIADFGFAKISSTGTSLTTMCGSPGYVAPEILNRQPYGEAIPLNQSCHDLRSDFVVFCCRYCGRYVGDGCHHLHSLGRLSSVS